MKKTISAILAATLGATLFGCASAGSSFAQTKEDKREVLTVESTLGSEKVQYQEYRYFFMNNKNDLYGADAALTEEQTAKVKSLTENNIKKLHAVNLAAKKHGAKLSKDEKSQVESYTENFRTSSGLNDDEYLLVLEQHFTTDHFFERLYENALLSEVLLDKLVEDGVIAVSDTYIDSALASDDILCVKEIYVGYNGEETREIARERAEEAFGKLTAGGDFEELMREYSDYSEESLPPKHGYYTMKYDALDVIWEAVNDLVEGEYSTVIESDYGFHIVMRCEKDREYMEANRDDIAESYTLAKFNEYLTGFMDKLTLTYTEYGENLDLSEMS